jgi:hypothetical protein
MNTKFREPTSRERRFIAAVRELAWSCSLLELDQPLRADAPLCPELTGAVVALALDAPDAVISAARDLLWGPGSLPDSSGLSLRNTIVESLADHCASVALGMIDAGDLPAAGRFTTAALRLWPARTFQQEERLRELFTALAGAEGAAEAGLAGDYPEIENDPFCDMRQFSGDFEPYSKSCQSIDPHMIPGLIRTAADKGACEDTVVHAVLQLLLRAHWPSWRALGRLGTDLRPFLDLASCRIREASVQPSPGACLHLEAILGDQNLELPPFGEVPF